MDLDDWPRSVFYGARQSEALIEDAHALYQVYTDPEFVDWATKPNPDHPPAETQVIDTVRFLRLALDLLILIHASQGSEQLASKVETYVIPSFEISSFVSSMPSGFAIGVTPFMQLVGEVAFLMRDAFRVSKLRVVVPATPGISMLDEIMTSWLRCFWARAPVTRVPSSRLHERSGEEGDSGKALMLALQRDTFDLAFVFALCHELAHIEAEHFIRPGRLASPGFVQDLPNELRWEVEADCASFTSMLNYYRAWHHIESRHGESVLMQGYRRLGAFNNTEVTTFMYVLGVKRVTQIFESYYTVMSIFGELAERAGDGMLAAKLAPTPVRKQFVRRYIHWLRTTELERYVRRSLWDESDIEYREMHDKYVARAAAEIIPAVVQTST